MSPRIGEEDGTTTGRKTAEPDSARGGIGHDAIVAVVSAGAGGIVGPVVQQVTDHFLNRPPREEPPAIVLPPGVHRE